MSDRTCSIEGCEKPKRTRGMCNAHYERWRLHGDVGSSPIAPYRYQSECVVDGCDNRARTREMCPKHYTRWLIHGNPLAVRDQRGENGTAWQGRGIGYMAAHDRVRAARGSARGYRCVACGRQAQDWAYNHEDPDEIRAPLTATGGAGMLYSPDPAYYQPMCKPCHKAFDGAHR